MMEKRVRAQVYAVLAFQVLFAGVVFYYLYQVLGTDNLAAASSAKPAVRPARDGPAADGGSGCRSGGRCEKRPGYGAEDSSYSEDCVGAAQAAQVVEAELEMR